MSISELRDMPAGYLRSVAIGQCHPSICNSGFAECFYHSESFDYLVPCVEFYERLNCTKMANIFRSVIIAIREQHGGLEGFIPDDYPKSFAAISTDLSELDFLYYEELKNLPTANNKEANLPWSAIGYYMDRFPEDFN